MKSYSSTSRARAQSLRKSSTDPELRMWHLLRNRNLHHFKFRRQHPIANYIVDFVCLEKKLVIEIDGGQHGEQAQYDEARTAALEAVGYRVIRFWNNDVLAKSESVLQVIYKELGCPSD
jgi:very-short-patch-repair endonuclease